MSFVRFLLLTTRGLPALPIRTREIWLVQPALPPWEQDATSSVRMGLRRGWELECASALLLPGQPTGTPALRATVCGLVAVTRSPLASITAWGRAEVSIVFRTFQCRSICWRRPKIRPVAMVPTMSCRSYVGFPGLNATFLTCRAGGVVAVGQGLGCDSRGYVVERPCSPESCQTVRPGGWSESNEGRRTSGRVLQDFALQGESRAACTRESLRRGGFHPPCLRAYPVDGVGFGT